MTYLPAKQSNFMPIQSVEDFISRDINGYFTNIDRDLQNLFQFIKPSIIFGEGEEGEVIQYDSNTGTVTYVSTLGGWDVTGDLLWSGTSATYIGLKPGTGIWLGDEAFLSAPFSVDSAGVLTAHSGEVGGWTLSETKLWKGSDLDDDYISLNPSVGIHMGAEDFDDAEFSVTKTGVLKAQSGTIGGWSLGTSKLYAGSGSSYVAFDTANGIWLGAETQGAAPFAVDRNGYMRATLTELTAPIIQTNANPGTDRVVINSSGIRGYDAVYGVTFILPTDGSAPTFANGIIQSATILDTTFISSDFKTSNELPWVEIGDTGVAYRETSSVGQYGAGALYGDGIKYGVGVTAYYGNSAKPILSVEAERTLADIRLYNRSSDPSGAAVVGDLCVVSGKLKICTVAGTPGTWTICGTQS
jgi:hypothetical protein